MKNPVNWFEITVTDMDRAKKFYGTIFNCSFIDLQMGPQSQINQMLMAHW
jgi:uncharacterized protein